MKFANAILCVAAILPVSALAIRQTNNSPLIPSRSAELKLVRPHTIEPQKTRDEWLNLAAQTLEKLKQEPTSIAEWNNRLADMPDLENDATALIKLEMDFANHFALMIEFRNQLAHANRLKTSNEGAAEKILNAAANGMDLYVILGINSMLVKSAGMEEGVGPNVQMAAFDALELLVVDRLRWVDREDASTPLLPAYVAARLEETLISQVASRLELEKHDTQWEILLTAKRHLTEVKVLLLGAMKAIQLQE